MGAAAENRALELARGWIRGGVPVELEITGRSLKAALKRADRDGFRAVAMLGDDELKAKTVTVRDLAAGNQSAVPFADLPAWWQALPPAREAARPE
jgi:histidyl-tRNA synthetase